MSSPSDPATQRILQLLLVALGVLFVEGDGLILALWIAGIVRRRPILARTWSVSHLFLGLQVIGAVVLGVGLIGTIAALILNRGTLANFAEKYSPVGFYAVLLPAMLAQQVALVAVPAVLVLLAYRGTVADLGLRRLDRRTWRQVGMGTLVAVALLPINDLVETLSTRWLLDPSHAQIAAIMRQLSEQASAIQLLAEIRTHPLPLGLMTLIIGVIGPVAEEVFFRGLAYNSLKRRFGVPAGILLSAAFFSAIHGNPLAFIPIFLMGVVLAWVYERTGSLAAPIGIHCANNLLVVVLYIVAPDFSLWNWLVGR
jgi:membrane protease YdiL (CAAX protease family)